MIGLRACCARHGPQQQYYRIVFVNPQAAGPAWHNQPVRLWRPARVVSAGEFLPDATYVDVVFACGRVFSASPQQLHRIYT